MVIETRRRDARDGGTGARRTISNDPFAHGEGLREFSRDREGSRIDPKDVSAPGAVVVSASPASSPGGLMPLPPDLANNADAASYFDKRELATA